MWGWGVTDILWKQSLGSSIGLFGFEALPRVIVGKDGSAPQFPHL